MELRREHTNKPSIWIAMDTKTRQVIACCLGHPRGDHARELLPEALVRFEFWGIRRQPLQVEVL
jgi:IS1 family transposase